MQSIINIGLTFFLVFQLLGPPTFENVLLEKIERLKGNHKDKKEEDEEMEQEKARGKDYFVIDFQKSFVDKINYGLSEKPML